MEKAKKDKRRVSVLVPYKIVEHSAFIFLQKRKKDRKIAPGKFGFFGGAALGHESPEEALEREIKEELGFVPINFHFYKEYDLPRIKDVPETILSLFIMRTLENFEEQVRILKTEGDFGEWFDKKKYLERKKSITGELSILDELYEKLPRIPE